MKRNFVVNTLAACGVLLLLGVAALFFGITTNNNQARALNAAVTAKDPGVEARTIEVRTVQYVDRPVTVVETQTRIEHVPVGLRNYETIEELTAWLADIQTRHDALYVEQPGQTTDCDDFARALQQDAMADGYLLNVQIMTAGEYNQRFTTAIPDGTLHAANLAIIGNQAYYVEPQTGEVALAADLD